MSAAVPDQAKINWREDGDVSGPAVVFAGSLGTDLRLWDDMMPYLPRNLRLVRYDQRGHGLSSCPDAPYSMGALISDAEKLLDSLGIRNCIFVGLSIGGMVAQGLAVKRPDLVRGLVLSNTAARFGTAGMWEDRIALVRLGGVAALADTLLEKWFSRKFRATDKVEFWRNMLIGTPVEGYVGCCAAISGTDFYTSTSGLRIPVLGIAGSEDGSSPPDLVRETVELVEGHRFTLMQGVGHLPCVEKPKEYAEVIAGFLKETGHV